MSWSLYNISIWRRKLPNASLVARSISEFFMISSCRSADSHEFCFICCSNCLCDFFISSASMSVRIGLRYCDFGVSVTTCELKKKLYNTAPKNMDKSCCWTYSTEWYLRASQCDSLGSFYSRNSTSQHNWNEKCVRILKRQNSSHHFPNKLNIKPCLCWVFQLKEIWRVNLCENNT